jgi:hypothetical protein
MSVAKVARLRAFISALQDMLGWQIDVEKFRDDQKEYTVLLRFTLTFKGKVWPDILRNSRYRLVVFEMVKNRLDELWDQERESFQSGDGAAETDRVVTKHRT